MADEERHLDDTDQEILYHLQTDARNTTNAEISDRVGVSATTVGTRIERLEDAGVVETYEPIVDYETAGFPYQMVLFGTVPTTDRSEVAREVLAVDGVIEVRELLSGTGNLEIELVGRTRDGIARTIADVEETEATIDRSEIVKSHHTTAFGGFSPE